MDTKILTLCSIIAVALLLQACPIDDLACEGVDENRYIISNPGLLSVYPEQTTFEVGDTIWVESSISSQQTTNTGNEVDIYEELGLNEIDFQGFLIGIKDNLNDTNPKSYAPNVEVIYGTANLVTTTSNNQFHQLSYSYRTNNNSYNLKLGYIMEETGYFSFNDPDLDRMRVVAKKGNGCGEKYSIYTSLANPNHGYAYEFEVVE